MTDARFAAAVAATLVPGGSFANGVTAPPADEALGAETLVSWLETEPAGAAVAAIEHEAGGAQSFTRAGSDRRTAVLRAAEARRPSEFRALVDGLLTLYYQHPDVIEAFGWRRAPPQPAGHALEEADLTTFANAAAREPIWRKVTS